MKILSVKDPAFRKYGRVVDNVALDDLVEAMKKTPVPEGVVYEPSVKELEELEWQLEQARLEREEAELLAGQDE